MMNLKNLIDEISSTADEAHKKGLIYKGHGYWKNAQGQTVARTFNGELQMLPMADTEFSTITVVPPQMSSLSQDMAHPSDNKIKRLNHAIKNSTKYAMAHYSGRRAELEYLLKQHGRKFDVLESVPVQNFLLKNPPMSSLYSKQYIKEEKRSLKYYNEAIIPALLKLPVDSQWATMKGLYHWLLDSSNMDDEFKKSLTEFLSNLPMAPIISDPLYRGMYFDDASAIDNFLQNFESSSSGYKKMKFPMPMSSASLSKFTSQQFGGRKLKTNGGIASVNMEIAPNTVTGFLVAPKHSWNIKNPYQDNSERRLDMYYIDQIKEIEHLDELNAFKKEHESFISDRQILSAVFEQLTLEMTVIAHEQEVLIPEKKYKIDELSASALLPNKVSNHNSTAFPAQYALNIKLGVSD